MLKKKVRKSPKWEEFERRVSLIWKSEYSGLGMEPSWLSVCLHVLGRSHCFNSRTQEVEKGDQKFVVTLGHVGRMSLALARDSVSKTEQNKTKQNHQGKKSELFRLFKKQNKLSFSKFCLWKQFSVPVLWQIGHTQRYLVPPLNALRLIGVPPLLLSVGRLHLIVLGENVTMPETSCVTLGWYFG